MNKILLIAMLTLLCSGNALAERRLVTAGGSLTEIIYALDAEALLVAVDSSSHYPPEAKSLPQIGYFRALNVEGVLSMKPDELLLLSGSGPQSVINQLTALSLKTTIIDNPKSVAGLIKTIRQVADAADRKNSGEILVKKVQDEIAEIKELSSLEGKKAVFLMSAGERGLVAAGNNTTPQLIFELLGLTNPFAELDNFKPVSAEAIVSDMPDIILLASHTSQDITVEALCADPQLQLWAEKVGCRLHKVDSLRYMGLTPRLPKSLKETHQLLSGYAN